MRLKDERSDSIEVHAAGYTLVFDRQRLLARFYSPDRRFYYHMSLISAVDTIAETDVTDDLGEIRIASQDQRKIVIEIPLVSRLWREKTGVYTCEDDRLSYHVRVRGTTDVGGIDRAYFFRGRYRESELASVPGFDTIFPACTNFLEKQFFHASEYASINAGHETFAWGYALASGPLCFAMSDGVAAPWLSVGLAPQANQWNFQSFEFNHKTPAVAAEIDSIVGTQAFSVAYYGHESVTGDGSWQPPALVMQFADDRVKAIEAYVRHLRDRKLVSSPSERDRRARPAWWSRPMFCGWHEQRQLPFARDDRRSNSARFLESTIKAADTCTQANYQRWLLRLEEKNCKPGTIIIDAVWQTALDVHEVDTTKWPDLRGFIDACHARDQRVLLWIDLWKHAQLPDGECAMLDGKPVCADPTNPAYVDRLKREIRYMLSNAPGCLNADGFKIDGQSVQPYGYGMKTQGGVYGFALQRILLELFYREAKRNKPDALISLFSANPLFADICDIVRVGDLYSVKGDPLSTMRKRAEIIRLGMPGVLIDTDGLFYFNLEYSVPTLIEEQAKIGVPTIYVAEEIGEYRTFAQPSFRPLSDQDYRAISKCFAHAWSAAAAVDKGG